MHRSNMRKRFLPFLVVFVALTAIMMTVAFAEGEAEYVSNFYASPLSLLPPVIAIILALITKEVISSLFLGILSGTVIYCLGMGTGDLIIKPVEIAFTTMVNKVDFNIIIFCTLLGALVFTISRAGGTRAYGNWATKRIKSKRVAMLSTGGLGAFIFIDDYFNCLTVGTVMRPVTDRYKISRAKLAYVIDATAAPICIIAPISSWAAAVGSNLKATGAFESDFAAFVATIPYNFYALFSIIMVVMVCLGNFDFGPMREAELRAQQGELGNVDAEQAEMGASAKGHLMDMLVPIGSLIVFAVLALLYSGGYWGSDPAYHTLAAAFGNCSASKALVWASFGALTVAFFMFVPRGLMSLKSFMDCAGEGMKAMMPANTILVLAWAISGVCRDLLQTPLFVKTLVADGGISGGLLPAIIFVVAGFLSFSTGTAWGTFGILIPIVTAIFPSDSALLYIGISACCAGAVCGDHCSPISDTTIMASAGAQCEHLNHVTTQLPYAVTVAIASFVGFIVAGFVQNVFVTWAVGIVLLLGTLFLIRAIERKKAA